MPYRILELPLGALDRYSYISNSSGLTTATDPVYHSSITWVPRLHLTLILHLHFALALVCRYVPMLNLLLKSS